MNIYLQEYFILLYITYFIIFWKTTIINFCSFQVIEVEGDWSNNFFRWVVDEASTNLDYEDVLFPVEPTDNIDYTYISDSSEGTLKIRLRAQPRKDKIKTYILYHHI